VLDEFRRPAPRFNQLAKLLRTFIQNDRNQVVEVYLVQVEGILTYLTEQIEADIGLCDLELLFNLLLAFSHLGLLLLDQIGSLLSHKLAEELVSEGRFDQVSRRTFGHAVVERGIVGKLPFLQLNSSK